MVMAELTCERRNAFLNVFARKLCENPGAAGHNVPMLFREGRRAIASFLPGPARETSFFAFIKHCHDIFQWDIGFKGLRTGKDIASTFAKNPDHPTDFSANILFAAERKNLLSIYPRG
jgi:hypothetical protein